MSHGSQGVVYGNGGEPIKIDEEIIAKFDGKNCPALENKPKVIFIQACQGGKKFPKNLLKILKNGWLFILLRSILANNVQLKKSFNRCNLH